MGRYQSNYVGPILLCRYDIVPQERRYPRCENSQCKAYRKRAPKLTPHCPQCGKEMGVETLTFQVPSVDDEMVATALLASGFQREDTFYRIHEDWCSPIPDGYHVFIPQFSEGEKPRRFFSDENELCLIASHGVEAIESEKKWLAETYVAEIAALSKIYAGVWVDWACLVYFN
jgi:hypothetical protein